MPFDFGTGSADARKNGNLSKQRGVHHKNRLPVEDSARSGGERAVFREIEGESNVLRALTELHADFDHPDLTSSLRAAECLSQGRKVLN